MRASGLEEAPGALVSHRATNPYLRAVMHPLIEAAAESRLPEWAQASEDRVGHMIRVAELMDTWGRALDLDPVDRRRWWATAMLHDALRDADPDSLRGRVPPELRDLPGGMLHGPAVAAQLQAEGVTDGPLLLAVRWHTTGHADFDRLGQALYLADFAEPGRRYGGERLAGIRDRVPGDMGSVLVEVAADRIGRTLASAHPLRPSTVAFWNSLVNHG